jgi:competence protein ComGC
MNTKGLNITEMILSFTVIGIVLIILFPSFSLIANNAKNESYKHTILLIENITELYIVSYDKEINKPKEISIKELIDKGIIDADLKDSRTNKPIPLDAVVVISKQKNGDYSFKYTEKK